MDNLSHTVAALLVAQAVTVIRARKYPEKAKRLRLTMYVVAAIANNLPDLDILYAGITGGGLGYLLHHRGFTHTIAGALALGILFFLVLKLWRSAVERGESGKKRFIWSRQDWYWIAAMVFIGPLLHLLMDYATSYGVHPFWPFNDRWYYGDTLFIIEPWLWVTITPLLIRETRTTVFKAFWSLIFAASLGLIVFSGDVPWQIVIFIILWSLWLLGFMKKTNPFARTLMTAVATLAIVAVFTLSGIIARHQIRETIEQNRGSGWKINNLIVTPLPSDPICWRIIEVETSKTRYRLLRGVFALLPHALGSAQCPIPGARYNLDGNLILPPPLSPIKIAYTPQIMWHSSFDAPKTQLRRYAKENCRVADFLRFARVPYWYRRKDGTLVVGDLRFLRSQNIRFGRILIPPNGPSHHPCPRFIPPWVSPMRDVF